MNRFTRARAPSEQQKEARPKLGKNETQKHAKNIPTPARPHQTSKQGRERRRRKKEDSTLKEAGELWN